MIMRMVMVIMLMIISISTIAMIEKSTNYKNGDNDGTQTG